MDARLSLSEMRDSTTLVCSKLAIDLGRPSAHCPLLSLTHMAMQVMVGQPLPYT